MADRPTLDEYFMAIVKLVATRSTCIKANSQRGAVLVKNKHIIATGYNGAPRGVPHCSTETCVRLNIPSMQDYENCRGVHAEMNTIIQAAIHGVGTEGAEIYTTALPCIGCIKALINAGVKRVVYLNELKGRLEDNKLLNEIVKQSGIIVEKFNGREIKC